MGNRKKSYTPKAFESTGRSNDTSANIYESMLLSAAYQDLNIRQRQLYVCMKAQYYGKRKPGKDYQEIDLLQGDDLFYFPMSLAEKYALYTRENHKQFYNDIKVIENHGFIQTVSNGKSTKSRSIYKFSGDWRDWNDTS